MKNARDAAVWKLEGLLICILQAIAWHHFELKPSDTYRITAHGSWWTLIYLNTDHTLIDSSINYT